MERPKNRVEGLVPVGVLLLLANQLTQNGFYLYTKNRWVYILTAAVSATLFLWLIAKAAKKSDGDGLFPALERRIGRFFTVLIVLLYLLYSLLMGAGYLRTYSELLALVTLRDMPLWLVAVPIAFTAGVLCRKRGRVLFSWARYVLPVLLFLMGLGIMLSLKNADWENLMPVMYGKWDELPKYAGISWLALFGQLTILLVPLCACRDREKAPRVMQRILLLAAPIIVLATLQNIVLLGEKIAQNSYYTTFAAYSTIDITPLLQRMEVLLLILLLLCGIGYLSLHFSILRGGVGYLTRGRYDGASFAGIFAALIAVSLVVAGDTSEIFARFNRSWYFMLFFHVVLPLAVFGLLHIRKKRVDNKKTDDYNEGEI